MWKALAIVLLLAAAAAAEDEGPCAGGDVVEIEGVGAVCGQTGKSARENVEIHTFLGIPFAAKPERFQAPTEDAVWDGMLDALDHAPACPQPDLNALPIMAGADIFNARPAVKKYSVRSRAGLRQREEDNCLTLDIYTPKLGPDARLPVFFYIHGGLFVIGSSSMATGSFLLEHGEMVLVSVQYRLGPDGFLAAHEEEAPGNAAMYDLLRALHWTRDHIAAFGGDPDHIVVGGVSAGAATAGLLYVSPLSRDLIKGAALFSGAAVSPWTVDADPVRSARGIGVFLGCLRPDTYIECLKSRTPTQLIYGWALWTVYEKYFTSHGMGGTIPAVEVVGDNKFLPRHPKEELLDKNFPAKPLLIGVTKHEGTFLHLQLDYLYIQLRGVAEDPRTLDHALGDILLEFSDVDDHLGILGDGVKRLYFDPETIGNYTAMYEGLVDFTGAGFFKGPAQRMARMVADRGAPAYLYEFTYPRNGDPNSGPVTHGQDQGYLFHQPGTTYSANDNVVVDTYCHMVATFVRDLKPEVAEVDWQPHTVENDHYLSLNLVPETRQGFSTEFYVMEQERQEAEDEDDDDDETSTQTEPTETTPPGVEPTTEEPTTTTEGAGSLRVAWLLLVPSALLLLLRG